PATSQIDCNIRCVNTPGVSSCMFYANRGNCVMLGMARNPPPGTCTRSYTCYEKRWTGCPVRTGPIVDRGYTPGHCSNESHIVGPPITGVMPVCGSPQVGQRKIVLDAILHDGTRLVLENHSSSFVEWDPYLGSWYYSKKEFSTTSSVPRVFDLRRRHYFLNANAALF
ncbi:hypothetical protein PENTCL1PPCAC_7532, partial [Pristionchus entomophagus]